MQLDDCGPLQGEAGSMTGYFFILAWPLQEIQFREAGLCAALISIDSYDCLPLTVSQLQPQNKWH
jgi:hypothetical protein